MPDRRLALSEGGASNNGDRTLRSGDDGWNPRGPPDIQPGLTLEQRTFQPTIRDVRQ